MPQSFKARLRQSTNNLLEALGLHIARRERVFEMAGLLVRSRDRGTNIATWIDVGASDGSWSLGAHRHYPSAHFLLFEPLTERRAALERLKRSHGFDYIAAAAGAAAGSIDFVIDAQLDGSGVAAAKSANTRSVQVETIDRVVAGRNLKGPFGIKLDTHGHEVPVLEGASTILPHTNLLIIEAYNFQLTPTSLRFHELCGWLESRGFRCCDLADPMRRASDGALWQMDLAFAPGTSPLFASNRYA
jgi:FkbM family methyltransferase